MDLEAISKTKEQLENFNEWYKNDEYGLKAEKRLLKLNNDFVNKFNLSFIRNEMALEDYCIGQANEENFCYIIERKLKGLGSILGATSKKFGVYYSKEHGRYLPTLKFGDTVSKAFKSVRNELVKIVDAAAKNELENISSLSLCYMVRHKIYYLYNPDNDLPIFSEEHLDKIIEYFDISYSKDENAESNKRKALLAFKNNDADFSKMSNRKFMCFLYDSRTGLDLKDKEIIDRNRNGETIEFVKVEKMGDLPVSMSNRSSDKKGKTNYDDVAARKSFIGEAGEQLVLKHEKEQHPQYKNRIKKVSDDDDSLGYDILSFDEEGNQKYIEVKTKKHGSASNVDFFITENERRRLLENPNHYIYYVCGIKNKKKTIYEISKEILDDVTMVPVLYRVKARIIE